MITHGVAPFLECSSKGDARFSAFFAKVLKNGRMLSIEEHYQRAKLFSIGPDHVSGLGNDWRLAKGRIAVNADQCRKFYSKLWDQYIHEHQDLLKVLRSYSGTSDIFGQKDHACQATDLWRIMNDFVNHPG